MRDDIKAVLSAMVRDVYARIFMDRVQELHVKYESQVFRDALGSYGTEFLTELRLGKYTGSVPSVDEIKDAACRRIKVC